eukprot:746504-Hanusia_phi.AAC.7
MTRGRSPVKRGGPMVCTIKEDWGLVTSKTERGFRKKGDGSIGGGTLNPSRSESLHAVPWRKEAM